MQANVVDEEKRRTLGLIPVSAIVVSNMIGTGIFTTTGIMIEMGAGGGDILLGWLLGGVIAFCGALCYGEIGAGLPDSGGEYHYLSRLLHPALGFVSGCVSLVAGFAAPIAAAAMAMGLYMSKVIPNWPVRTMAIATILILSLLHAYDLRLGGRVQTGLMSVKLLLLLAFIAGIWLHKPRASVTVDFSFSLGLSPSFAVVLVLVSFAYSGWNAAAYVGAEIRRPERTLPSSLLIGTGVVTLLYLLVNLAYLSAVPLSRLAGVEQVAQVMGEQLWGRIGGDLVALLIALAMIAPVSAMIILGPRVGEAMAKDGLLPARFAILNRRQVPSYAVWFQGALASLFVLTASFGPLLIYIGVTLNIFAVLTALSLFRLRRNRLSRSRICIGYPVTPLVFSAFSLWMIVWSVRFQPLAALASLATIILCYAAYVVTGTILSCRKLTKQ